MPNFRSYLTHLWSTQKNLLVFVALLFSALVQGQIAETRSLKDLPFEEIEARLKSKNTTFNRGSSLVVINHLLLQDFTEQQLQTLKIYRLQGLVELELYDEALLLANELLTPLDLAPSTEVGILLERTLIYELVNNMPASKKDLNRIERIYDDLLSKSDENYGRFLSRLASWYRVNDRIVEAKEWAQKAIDYGIKHGFEDVSATGYLILGLAVSPDRFNVRIKYFNEGLQLWKNAQFKKGCVDMYTQLSKTYLNNDNLDMAAVYNDSALSLINHYDTGYKRGYIYRQRSKVFENLLNLDSALFFQKQYAVEEISNLKRSRNVKVRELEFNLKKELSVLENVKLENKLAEASRKETYFTSGLLVAAAFLFCLGFLIITLASRNKRINEQNQEIKKTNKDLSTTVQEKEFLLQEVNHRVKNNLAFVQSLIAFQKEDAQAQETRSNLESLNNRIHAIAVLHDQFVDANNSISKKEIYIEPYIATIADAQIVLHPERVTFKAAMNDIKINLETAVPVGILINELLTNSIKHAVAPNGILSINLSMEEIGTEYHLIYMDNGTGFHMDGHNESLGSYIIKTMVRQMRGTMHRDGSRYSIIIKGLNK